MPRLFPGGSSCAFAACALAVVLSARTASAQTCTTGPRVPFAGHNFPLDSIPDPKPMTLVSAYPNLVLDRPTSLVFAPDGSGKAIAAEQSGRVRLLPANTSDSSASVYLDLTGDVLYNQVEQGLLGVAFDPAFATNHFIYVNYISAACQSGTYCTKVVRYTQSAANPSVADPASRFEILQFPRPADFHNGGMTAFGPDGMLYIASGDAGTYNSQDTSQLYGEILRIDPHGGTPYAIPPNNPFVGQAGKRAEIWDYGLRNPYRFSFDRLTGDLWIGDVGQYLWEEVDFSAAGVGGLNFGWAYCEGTHDFPPNHCSDISSTPPVIEYPHDATGSAAVTGGYVYRGDRMPELYGAYIYADYESGTVSAYSPATHVSTAIAQSSFIASFAEDTFGELYLVSINGGIYQLQPSQDSGTQQFPTALSATGLFSSTANLTPAPGLVEYDVNTPLWSDNAIKKRWLALPGTQHIGFSPSDAWTYPVGTAFVKQFDLPTGPATRRHVETRVFLRQVDRWVGYTYRWNAAQTDATLLTAAMDEALTVDTGAGPTQQTWHYPSPSECLGCHTAAAGRVLGARTVQLNRSFAYPGGSANELQAFGTCLGLFDTSISPPLFYGSYADVTNTAETVGARARSYLAANCAHCHMPGGPAPGGMDMRYQPLLGGMSLIGVAPSYGDFGVSGAQRVHVGSKEQSVLWLRMSSSDPNQRMAKGTLVPDPVGVPLIGSWIDSGLSVIDSDGDGVPDAVDNCPYEPNASQTDRGGWLSLTPDGIGDACQCANIDAGGAVTLLDEIQLRASLAGKSRFVLPGAGRRCSYTDEAGRPSILDSTHLRRAIARSEPPPAQTCPAATRLNP
ncbi:MAG: PQQ-dependent sugar dehydrogenase [Myxococcota bacterium]